MVDGTLVSAAGTWAEGYLLDEARRAHDDGIVSLGTLPVPAASDVGHTFRFVVPCLWNWSVEQAGSVSTARVNHGALAVGKPAVEGSKHVGMEMVAEPRAWTPGMTLAYQWEKDRGTGYTATQTGYTTIKRYSDYA